MNSRQPILLLDVMDTLVVDPFFEAMPRFFKTTLDELLKQKHPDSWKAFERGELSEQEYLASFFADGRAIDGPGLRRMLWEQYRWVDGMEQLCAELHAAGAQMHALSNYSIWYRIVEAKLKLSRFLDWSLVSCHTGLRKPDPKCYRFALQATGAAPKDVIFVDDREVNIAAAREAGIDGILMHDAAQLRDELADRGLLPD